MPNLNLRLSREEHEELVARAAANARSLQREVIWCLFRGREEDGSVQAGGGVRPGGDIQQPRDSVDVPVAVAAPVRRPSSGAKCVRYQRHHINHSGNPCPECNYPLEGAVT